MVTRRSLVAAPLLPALSGQSRAPEMFGNAEAYQRFMGRWSGLLAPQLLDFANLPAQGFVLDAGSGTGALAFAIAERQRRVRVAGIDPSKEYVGFAASRNRFPDRAAFEEGDAQNLRFAGETFDAALSLLVFNFIPDAGKALQELRRVTKPGGWISAAVWDYGEGMQMLRNFWDAAAHADPDAQNLDEKKMPLCRKGELSALWRNGGLQNVSERAIRIPMRFTSFSDYWDPFLLGQGPAGAYARRVDAARLGALRDEIKRRLRVAREDAPIVLSGQAWAVRGRVPHA